MSFNNIYVLTCFSIIRIILTIILVSILNLFDNLKKSYQIIFDDFSVYLLLKIVLIVFSSIYIWYVVFKLEVFRLLILLLFLYVRLF